jgi:hypothetical protein
VRFLDLYSFLAVLLRGLVLTLETLAIGGVSFQLLARGSGWPEVFAMRAGGWPGGARRALLWPRRRRLPAMRRCSWSART